MASIKRVSAKEVKDSGGAKTVQALVELQDGTTASSSVPHGKSTGSFEAAYVDASRAVQNIQEKISPALQGIDARDQKRIDETILELDGTKNKERLGANAALAVSLACARAGAKANGAFLWQHIQGLVRAASAKKPKLLMNLINGGLHARNNLEFQEYLVIPRANTVRESFHIGKTIYEALRKKFSNAKLGDEGGIAPDFTSFQEPFELLQSMAPGSARFGLDASASNSKKTVQELTASYEVLFSQFNLNYLEDPFSENDFASFEALTQTYGARAAIVGDDLTATNPKRMDMAKDSINGIIIKPNQIGTLSETLEAVEKARQYGWQIFVSHRSQETQDSFIADLAWAIGADGIKAGAPGPKERLAKYERLLEIEERETL